MPLEAWKTLFEWGGVGLLFLTFAFGAGALYTTRLVNERQAEQLRQFDKDLTDAKTELGAQQERAAKAEAHLKQVENTAGAANERAGAANERAGKLEVEAAAQRERAATLEKEAADSKLETEKLKQVVAWRTISPMQGAALMRVLSAKAGAVNLRYTDGDPESLYMAIQLSNIFVAAGWKVGAGAMKSNGIIFGIALPDTPDTQALRAALVAARIEFSINPLAQTGIEFGTSKITGAPTLMVGSRPPVIP